MNLTVRIYDFIQNSRLFEMANELAEVKKEIANPKLNRQVRLHLLRLYLWGNITTENHWKGETVGFSPELPKVKSRSRNKGYLTQEEILQKTWVVFEDSIVDKFEQYVKTVFLEEENLKYQKIEMLMSTII